MVIHHIDDVKTFDSSIKSKNLVVVDFSAKWCGPCKKIEPFIEKLSGVHTSVLFLKVDVDELSDVASKYEVNSMPTFIFYINGIEVDRLRGARQSEIEQTIKKHS